MKKATRQSYRRNTCKTWRKNKNIVVFDADLSSSTKTNIFGNMFKR